MPNTRFGKECAARRILLDTSTLGGVCPGADEEVTSRASRVGRRSPRPISFEGRRFEQIENAGRLGLGQRTGLRSDASGVFFVTMALDAGRREIVVRSERREGFGDRNDDGSAHELP